MAQHHVTLIIRALSNAYLYLFVCNRFFAHVLFAPVKITHVLIVFVAASIELQSKSFLKWDLVFGWKIKINSEKT